MNRGWRLEEVERRKEKGLLRGEKLIKREKDKQRKEREKIGDSKYNKWYGRVKEEGIPEYLKKNWEEKDGRG